MNQETQDVGDICEWLGSPFGTGAGQAWLTPLRDAYSKACGARIFLNYIFSLLGVVQAQLEHFGMDKLTGQISANFDLANLQEFSDAQLATRPAELYLDFPDNWRFTVACHQTEDSEYPVCRCALFGPGVTHYYPPKREEETLSYVSLAQAVEEGLVVRWLREAIETYMQEA